MSTLKPYDQYEQFSLSGGSNGSYSDAKYFVVLDEETQENPEANRVLKYVSYNLEYRGLNETSIEESADYLVIVSYIDSSQNPNEQSLQMVGASKRVYQAIGEIRPSWLAVSKHLGRPKFKKKMLPMHAMALRDFAGGNLSPYLSSRRVGANDEHLIDVIARVESDSHNK